AQALPLLQQAAKMPQVADWLGPELARAQRAIEGESAQVAAPESGQLKRLLSIDNNTIARESPYWAYAALKGGFFDHALATKQGSPELDARVLSMVAASDGAPAEIVTRALAQTVHVEGDPASAWAMAALAMRERHAAAPRLREEAMRAEPEEAAKIAAFFDAVRRGGAASTAEAERYMAIPGQALAYKIGELKIMELRKRAEKELGARFDIREFHAEMLKDGSLPLEILDKKIDRWIAAKKA
ncbi:DUF885 family protein, partial [Lysobacter sp. 2RAB21]